MRKLLLASVAFVCSVPSAEAEDRVDTVHVTDSVPAPQSTLSTAPEAQPASTTVVDAAEVARKPVQTYLDLFRGIEGINVANYGQGGLGMGVAMRGFTDSEHGRDVAYFIDGMPINEVSSIHAWNYADLNLLLPETVDRIEVVRGPFDVQYGEANIGGSINITTKTQDTGPSAGMSFGSFGTGRATATYSHPQSESSSLTPYIAAELYTSDGYRQNSDNTRGNLFSKFTMPVGEGTLSTRVQVYAGDWQAPGFINAGQIRAGSLSDKAAVNLTDGGQKNAQNAVLNYKLGEPENDLAVTAFVSHDDFSRFSTFGTGSQSAQFEHRTTTGATVRKLWTTEVVSLPTEFMLGSNVRSDIVTAVSSPTISRRLSGAYTIDEEYTEENTAAFAQVQVKPVAWVKLTAGARYDHFFYDIDNKVTPSASPTTDTGVASPKVGISVTPLSWLEMFANYGQGFRSPSAGSDLPATPGLKPQEIASRETGGHITWGRIASFSGSVWTSQQANEIYQSAPGQPYQQLGSTDRVGFDLDGRVYVSRQAGSESSIFANFNATSAKAHTAGVTGFVPDVPSYIANIGVDGSQEVKGGDAVNVQAYVQFVGPKYLTEDGALKSKVYQVVNGKVTYTLDNGLSLFGQGSWYPGDRLSEIAFASGGQIYTDPQPTLTTTVGVNYHF
ncbi:TonB-dependent receptor domain-containing protein [Telmatospirillum sp.]|uniref:TonB-dependent receptor n=1 Tax=Telmatospirillum sp. TaxID=2079197 RepID=UPI002849334B|nr:TonB-dependent receptor [Telmatospirillum sp.]MDR3434985.1 TonB-dependent receptor [Telmatospirillum sp.]